jgi:hypothetical protein
MHVAVSIKPTMLISELVGTLKGYSSHEVNRRLGMRQKVLQWQKGCGVISFGTGDLPWVAAYNPKPEGAPRSRQNARAIGANPSLRRRPACG